TPTANNSQAKNAQGVPKTNGKPVAKPAAPKSFVEEMKTSEAQKRKQVDPSQETAAKKVKSTSTATTTPSKEWSKMELKCEIVGAINQSMMAVLTENSKPLPLTKLRKKTVKKLMEHPRNTFTKEAIKDAFDQKLTLTLKDSVVCVSSV
ncbi:hypothetical protein IWQ62_004155, partial [Dispira parvispora]